MNYYLSKVEEIRKNCFSNESQIETVIATKNFIDTHYEKDLKLDFLAHHKFTSKFHLQRLFKKYYGMTPKQYLIDRRIEKSKDCLKIGMTVTATCFEVGFTSLSSFSRLFKSKIGISPSEFQKKQV